MVTRPAVVNVLKWCVSLRGRATRREFWYFLPIVVTVNLLAADMDSPVVITVYLILLIPLISVGVRRLHDTGHSGGWWWLVFFVVGLIALLILWSRPSEPHANRYGPAGRTQ